MLGVLASYKSLRGLPMKKRWAEQTPTLEHVAEQLFTGHRNVLNYVHYSADDDAHLALDLVDIAQTVGSTLGGLQVNIPWPSTESLADFHRVMRGRRHSIVLQISEAAVLQAGATPEDVTERLRAYGGLADGLLFDMSGGEGKPLEYERAQRYLRAFADAELPFHLGVAGSLGPDSMDPVEGLLAEFPRLSWDAQRRLRNDANELDQRAVMHYLYKSYSLVQM
jgi:hypothetical protein